MTAAAEAAGFVALALAFDVVIGDPDRIWRRWPHPVALMGAAIALADRCLNREGTSRHVRKGAGIAVAASLVAGAAGVGWAVERIASAVPFGFVGSALVASILLAFRSLRDHVGAVERAFATDGLPGARRAVAMIVGRDPERLDEAGVCRAAIESAAENLSDGVIAPAFWLLLAGLPGLLAYKAINTADSMIGHMSTRHRDFGWASARLDDLLNLVPARLSGILIAAAAPAGGGKVRAALDTMWRDARLHRSPNAGWPESAMAGALGLALAGPRLYAAGPVHDPFLNPDGETDARPADIGQALRVLDRAALLHVAFYGAVALVIWSAR